MESGRTALYLALHGLGIQPGDTVVLPRYCFYSLVNVVEGMGCTARFAPINPDTFALDPGQLAEHMDGASAVVVIHPFGQLADMAGYWPSAARVVFRSWKTPAKPQADAGVGTAQGSSVTSASSRW